MIIFLPEKVSRCAQIYVCWLLKGVETGDSRITDLPAVMNASMELSLNSGPGDVLTALYTNIQHDIIITTKNNSINIILRCDRRVYTTPC